MLSIDHRWITFPHCVWEPFVAVRADGSVVTRGDPDFGGEVGVVSPSDVDAIYSANYEFATVQYCHARYNVGDHSFADAGASGIGGGSDATTSFPVPSTPRHRSAYSVPARGPFHGVHHERRLRLSGSAAPRVQSAADAGRAGVQRMSVCERDVSLESFSMPHSVHHLLP